MLPWRCSAAAKVMMSFIGRHRAEYGVDPICQQRPMAPSTYYRRQGPASRSTPVACACATGSQQINPSGVRKETFCPYGVWRQLKRERIVVPAAQSCG